MFRRCYILPTFQNPVPGFYRRPRPETKVSNILYPTTATASISIRSLGSIKAETSTIEDAG
jgi:hypothetical protein